MPVEIWRERIFNLEESNPVRGKQGCGQNKPILGHIGPRKPLIRGPFLKELLKIVLHTKIKVIREKGKHRRESMGNPARGVNVKGIPGEDEVRSQDNS